MCLTDSHRPCFMIVMPLLLFSVNNIGGNSDVL